MFPKRNKMSILVVGEGELACQGGVMSKTITVAFFDTKPYDRAYFERARALPEFADVEFKIDYFEGHLDASTASLASGHEVVCVFVNDHLDRAVIDALAAGGVRLIALRCAGYNNVDLEAVWQRIHVVRVPAYSPHAVAEHAAALLQTLNRRIHTAYNRTRDGNFALSGLVGRDLYGKTAGIIGTGKIGKIFAEILKGYGMKILLNDLFPDEGFAASIGARYATREEIYAASDVISLHCPLTPENRYMINEATIAQMKPEVILINTGRGGLIDTKALIEALKDGRVRGAGLDVYEEEDKYFFEDWSLAPIKDDVLARLLQFPNVLLTAHQAFLTEEALGEIARVTLGNARQWALDGKTPNEVCYQCRETGKAPGCAREGSGRCW
jgi:D-lactate dehydrogenase